MNVNRHMSVVFLIAGLFLAAAPLGCSEGKKEVAAQPVQETGKVGSQGEPLFAGLIVHVDIEGRQIELGGNVLLKVTDQSRLIDRGGNSVDLKNFAESASEEPAQEYESVSIAYYETSGYEEGTLVLDWISLAGPLQE